MDSWIMNAHLFIATAHAALPPEWMLLPFGVLLLCIALMPLLAASFWERHYAKVSVGLGLLTLSYYGLMAGGAGPALLHVAQEYTSFMALVGSLFVISGGINIRVKGEATPGRNVAFLAIGALLANVIGTTGASMLMIRPWIRMNKYRITNYHIVYFIFIISNCGGCLTPVGDPPLFLGFLRGVPFSWTLSACGPAFLMVVGALLGCFYVLDRWNFQRAPESVRELETANETFRVRGLPNLFFLGVVLLAVFLPSPWQEMRVLGVLSVPSLVMILAALGSYWATRPEVHEANDFHLDPVKEVGFLFIGIFLTMMPALQLLQSGSLIQLSSPLSYYLCSGALSAFLDNAPTYLSFLAAGMGSEGLDVNQVADVKQFVVRHPEILLAVSLGSVFFGAGSYIGNGPNFMVKSIADRAKVHSPDFLRYIWQFSLPILVPILVVVGWLILG
jgi:Na+/H+ antiporter NhaD/arsenite permease-like protein